MFYQEMETYILQVSPSEEAFSRPGVTQGKIRWRLVQLKKTKGPPAVEVWSLHSRRNERHRSYHQRQEIEMCIYTHEV